ncbi:unnamed protein product [Brassica oleracea]
MRVFHLASIDYIEDLVTYNAADHNVEQVPLITLKKGLQVLIWISSSGEKRLKLASVSKIVPRQRTHIHRRPWPPLFIVRELDHIIVLEYGDETGSELEYGDETGGELDPATRRPTTTLKPVTSLIHTTNLRFLQDQSRDGMSHRLRFIKILILMSPPTVHQTTFTYSNLTVEGSLGEREAKTLWKLMLAVSVPFSFVEMKRI